jgi:Ctr copper transporter family
MEHASVPATHGLHGVDAMDMDMDMSMSMTFSKLGSYKVKILWDWWDVKQPFEYFLSCLFVVALAIAYHALRRLQGRALRELVVAKVSVRPELYYGLRSQFFHSRAKNTCTLFCCVWHIEA